MCESRREVRNSSSVFTPVSILKKSLRVRSAITTSSSDAFPARSPMPLMVHSIWRAPFITPVTEFATACPRSLWQCTESTYRPSWRFRRSRIFAMRWPHSCGIA